MEEPQACHQPPRSAASRSGELGRGVADGVLTFVAITMWHPIVGGCLEVGLGGMQRTPPALGLMQVAYACLLMIVPRFVWLLVWSCVTPVTPREAGRQHTWHIRARC